MTVLFPKGLTKTINNYKNHIITSFLSIFPCAVSTFKI